MFKLLIAVSLTISSLFLTPFVVASEPPIQVLTFNIRYGTARDEGHTWDLRREAVVGAIEELSPDFVGLQEALDFQNDFILENLNSRYTLVGEGREGGRTGEHASILFDADKYTLVRADRFWLSDTPDIPGSKTWSDLPRILTWIEVLNRKTSQRFLVMNTHFSHVSDEARSKSAEMILKRLQSISPPDGTIVFLMGDFNCRPDSTPHATLTDSNKGFHDTQQTLGAPEQRTFNGFRDNEPDAGKPIDWILYKGPVAPLSYRVLTEKREGVLPSDHYPVLAGFKIKAQP
ncbi:MAG: endonuclease/exonuclease/phosphatase family protein [Candidatus Omnitrophica bacterium]|nr:endonuclease/exonuclease/phosphatase family protein [Candidatus Omnitrophota bacterium]